MTKKPGHIPDFPEDSERRKLRVRYREEATLLEKTQKISAEQRQENTELLYQETFIHRYKREDGFDED